MKPRIADMTPNLQIKFAAFSARMAEAGIPFALTCVLRTEQEQEALYAQGRELLVKVNELRSKAKMRPISEEENKRVVTNTKRSLHFPNQEGKSKAFDIVILRGDAKWEWDVKFDGNADGIADYLEAAMIGQNLGLEVGGLWNTFKDWPHYQEKV